MSGFQKATKRQSRARVALIGPSGSGKTYTALSVATALGRVAVIDTERGSASKYAHLFDFDVLELQNFDPRNYVKAIAEAKDYDVVVIDSLSHAWSGKGGALEIKDEVTKRSRSNDSFGAWREVTPIHNQLVDAILGAPNHVIVTMRSKTEYVVEQDDRGKNRVRKLGLAPVQRDGLEYEFDVVADLTLDHDLIVSKTRCDTLDGAVINRPGKQLADTLQTWLSDGIAGEQGTQPPDVGGERAGGSVSPPAPAPPSAKSKLATSEQFIAIQEAVTGLAGGDKGLAAWWAAHKGWWAERGIPKPADQSLTEHEAALTLKHLDELRLAAEDESFAEHG